MKHLKVWQKLLLMGVVFMLPFGVVATKLLSSIDAMGAEFMRQEVRGLDYYTPLGKLVRSLQRHRDMAGAALAGDRAFQESLIRVRGEIDTHIKALDLVDQELDTALQTRKRWAALLASCRNLLDRTSAHSVDTSYREHTAVIEEAMGLISFLSDSSKLSLDSEVDTYYLANFLMLKGPEIAEVLSQARATGTAMIASKARTPEQTAALIRAATLGPFLQKRLDGSLGKALSFNEGLKAEFDAEARAGSDGVRAASDRIARLAKGERDDVTAVEFYAAMTATIDKIFETQEHASATVRGLLTSRIQLFQDQLRTTLGWTVLGLLGVCALGVVIMRDLTRTMRQVVATADRIALGDLSVQVNGTARRDEIGELARSFDRMIATMKETVGVAERIASGDLAATVQPRSEQDALGHALANMVERLSVLVGEVQRSGIRVNTSVNEIAATSRQQEATAREIAATTTEIGATSREIAATSKELVRTMHEVVTVADQSAVLAGNGQVGLTRMEDTMRQVMEAASSINAKLAVLNQKATNINQVVTTITKVADQTNLLSLNAAIEAEKAGEYGRGFAVVATEIRRLADQTAVATFDIDQMVKEIQSAVSAGVMGMDKFSEEVRRGMQEVQQVGGQLSQIIQHVQALVPRFDAVNEGMQAQATGAEQITQSLAQLGDAAQQTVDSLAQANEVIDGLNQAANGMRSGVSRFKLVA